MDAQVLRGTKEEIAEKIRRMPGAVREAIVIFDEPIVASKAGGVKSNETVEDMFAEMEPYMVNVGDADFSREAIYTRMEGE